MTTTVSIAWRRAASVTGLPTDAACADAAPALPIAAAPIVAARPPSNRRRSGERGLSEPGGLSLMSLSSCWVQRPARRLPRKYLSNALAPASLLHRNPLIGIRNLRIGQHRRVIPGQ